MKPEELLPYAQKYIRAYYADGTSYDGFMSNPDVLKEGNENCTLNLLSGVAFSPVEVSKIVRIMEVNRETGEELQELAGASITEDMDDCEKKLDEMLEGFKNSL